MSNFLRLLSLFCAAFVMASCSEKSGNNREFTVRGIVRGIAPDQTTLDIQHEEIPDYMPEMTMPFVLKETKDARDVKVGDAISFRLVVDDKEAAVDRIRKIPLEQVQIAPPAPVAATAATTATRLKPGDPLPAFMLTDQDGRVVAPETFRGRPLVLTFIFTRCPVPNFCPLLSQKFAQLQDAIRSGGDQLAQSKLLSISIDPGFDTPDVLRSYGASEEADFRIWSFATGSASQIAGLTKAFALMVQPEGGTISHGLATALIDAEGRIVEIWRGNGWKPEEVTARITSGTSG